MKLRLHSLFAALAWSAIVFLHPISVNGQGTSFTYQGSLNAGGLGASGFYDLRFGLYDALSAGAQQGSLLTNSATGITNGLFTVELDFGNQFPGANRWLEIAVRTNGIGSFTALSPRQPFTSVPYALRAANYGGPVPASQITGTLTSANFGHALITGSNLAAGAVTAANIASNTITAAQLAAVAAVTNLNASGQSGVGSGGIVFSATDNNAALANAGYVKIGVATMADAWVQEINGGSPPARYKHTAVWTGSEMMVWGGLGPPYLNDGGRFNPAANTWTVVSTSGAPSARGGHTVVWTGTEMIVWGGVIENNGGSSGLNDGGRYNPAANSWTAVSANGAPAARSAHTAVWTGTEMIVWGGFNGVYLNDGGRYNPAGDSWTPVTSSGAPPARELQTVVWTGSEMIIWGGFNGGYLNDGGRYNPAGNSWTATTTLGAPSGRDHHTAVWTGTQMIIWGGDNGPYPEDAGRYNPASDSWTGMATNGAPMWASDHTAVWTGREMIVWGGQNSSYGALNGGARYNPVADSWTAVSVTNSPPARYLHTAIWTGTEMIVWGGINGTALDDGGRYNPASNSWIPLPVTTPSASTAAGRAGHTAVWTGSEMIVWGGIIGFDYLNNDAYLNDGWRYDPAGNSWRRVVAPIAIAGRYGHTAVWTGSEMIVWGGANDFGYLNDGWRYNPASGNWVAVATNGAPAGRYSHTAVWTGTEMIVWGGATLVHGGSFGLNDGGRYRPAGNSWTTVATNGAPAPRYLHTAVWTGTEMIVWGGSENLNDGGRYNPSSGIWTAVTTSGAPFARYSHTAVWTGSAMIIWGGSGGSSGTFLYGDGLPYFPASNQWGTMTTNGAPSARYSHTAVWTGIEIIIWGGRGTSGDYLNNGGRYSPAANSWAAITTNGAPGARGDQTAVWTGSEMIIWGGYSFNSDVHNYLNDGARYRPAGNTWTSVSPAATPTPTTLGVPSARKGQTAVWTGAEMIVWGGSGNSSYLNDGGRYNPAANSWAAISTIGAPLGRLYHTAVWTGSEMIVWGGGGDSGYLKDGGCYNPAANSWAAINTNGAPAARGYHTAVWAGSEMLIWGGSSYSGIANYFNDGGRYSPSSDSWTSVTTSGAPSARDRHTAVWTGTEMLVWGGYGYSSFGPLNDGGRYNASSNSWTTINTNGSPSARYYHTAVWTGTEMIVWGGYDYVNEAEYFSDGGRYRPSTDGWTALAGTGAPSARAHHTAVWTGTEMLVWGGFDGAYLGDGGHYNPAANDWAAVSSTGAPAARTLHSAVWTGSEMIVWGGFGNDSVYLNDTWSYTPGISLFLYQRP